MPPRQLKLFQLEQYTSSLLVLWEYIQQTGNNFCEKWLALSLIKGNTVRVNFLLHGLLSRLSFSCCSHGSEKYFKTVKLCEKKKKSPKFLLAWVDRFLMTQGVGKNQDALLHVHAHL